MNATKDQVNIIFDKLYEYLDTKNELFHKGLIEHTSRGIEKWKVEDSNNAFALKKSDPITVSYRKVGNKHKLQISLHSDKEVYTPTRLTYDIKPRWFGQDKMLKKFIDIYSQILERDRVKEDNAEREHVDNSIIEAFPDIIDDILLK